MNNPVVTYQLHAQRLGIPDGEVEGHIEYMKKAMLYPPVQDKNCLYATQHATTLTEIEVFAHGSEVMRLAKAVPFAQQTNRQEWLVQSLSTRDNLFITQKAYPFDGANPLAAQLAYNAAHKDAKDWYPAPDKDAYFKKWDAIMNPGDEAVPPGLNSREKLAEFWYDSKAIDWNENERPFPYEFAVAQYLLSAKAFQRDPAWADHEYEEIQTYAWNMLDAWGGDELKNTLLVEGSRPIIINNFHDEAQGFEGNLEYHINKNMMHLEVTNAQTGTKELLSSMLPTEFPNIADVRGIDDDDKARIFKTFDVSQQEEHKNGNAYEDYETAIDANSTKIITYDDGSEGYFIVHPENCYTLTFEDKAYFCDHNSRDLDTKFQSRFIDFDNEYLISVYSVKYTSDDYENGSDGTREELEICEKYSTDQIRELQNRYGYMVPGSESPADTYVWFKSPHSIENTDYFENGIDTFFEVHVLEINDQEPTSSGIQRFADLIKTQFRNPIALPQSDFATPVPDKASAQSFDNTF